MTVAQLEDTDDPIGPSRYNTNSQQTDNAGDHAKRVECCRNREDTETDLRFHH